MRAAALLTLALTWRLFFSSAVRCEGEWLQTSGESRSDKDSNFTCPFFPEGAHSGCTSPRQERVSNLRNFVLSNDSSCHDFDPQSFLRNFTNRRLILIGDSVLTQVWLSLVCDVFESLPLYQRNKSSSVVHVANRGAASWKGGYKIGIDSVHFVEANVTVIGSRFDWFYKKNSALVMLQEYTQSDLVVLNFGLHYNDYSGKNPRDADKNDFQAALLHAVSGDIVALNRPDWDIWFTEVTPQHFTGDNAASGYYNQHGGKICKAYNDTVMAQKLDWRNVMLRNRTESLLPPNVHLVTLPALASQWDAHIEMDDESKRQHVHLHFADCTHWCNPSDYRGGRGGYGGGR